VPCRHDLSLLCLIYAEVVKSALPAILVSLMAMSASAQRPVALPRFEDFPVSQSFKGTPATPTFQTAEQQQYRTRIREGVLMGRGVWTGTWKDAKERKGPNFAGHYFVIRWGCGSDCLMMAIVDAETGKVSASPIPGGGSELFVSMDIMSDREIDFRLNSSLMIFRNACRGARTECGVYYFNWKDNHFDLVKKRLVDLTKVERK
jgi:hypothetical protein